MTTTQRTIYFYRVDSGIGDGGKPESFDPLPSLRYVDRLPFDFRGRYLSESGRILCCWVESQQPPYKLILGSIRRSDLPQVESQGEVTALEIPENSGLVEQTHIVFFENGIAGCDFNFYGPRIIKLASYLAEKAVGIAPPFINFSPILRRDILRQLKKLKYLTLFQLRIRAPFVDTISNVNAPLSQAFKEAIKAGEADDVEVILRCSRRSKGWLSDQLIESAQQLSRHPDTLYETTKFVVGGYNESDQKSMKLDLLSDKLLIKKSIARVAIRSKALNARSAFTAIISAYEELREEIELSPSVEL